MHKKHSNVLQQQNIDTVSRCAINLSIPRYAREKCLRRIPARAATSALLPCAQPDQETSLLAYLKQQQCEFCSIRGWLTQIEVLFLNTAGNLRRRVTGMVLD